MNSQEVSARPNTSGDMTTARMHILCCLLDVFASADPVARAGAAHYSEQLRDEGCEGGDIIQLAATTLLVALEREIEQRETVLSRLPARWTGATVDRR